MVRALAKGQAKALALARRGRAATEATQRRRLLALARQGSEATAATSVILSPVGTKNLNGKNL